MFNRDSRQPVSRKCPARFAGLAPHAESEPQIPLRQRQADPEMARAAPDLFAVAQRRGLPRRSTIEPSSKPPRKIKSKDVHVIGLGCGGGQKDTRLLKLLKAARQKDFLHAVRCQHCDGSRRAPGGAGSCAGEKLFSIRLRPGDGGRFARRTCHPSPVTGHFLRHDSELRAAGNFAETRGAGSAEGLSAVQRQPCARGKLRRRQ